MGQHQKDDINNLIADIQATSKANIKSNISLRHKRVIKKVKQSAPVVGNSRVKDKLMIANTIKDKILNTDKLLGQDLNINKIANSKPQKELLQEILRKHKIDENAVAETLLTLKDDPDYRARESFIDRSVRFLGYNYQEKEQQSTTTNNVVFMPDILLKKYRKDNNINQIIEDGDLIAE